jgi:hypothetical protein
MVGKAPRVRVIDLDFTNVEITFYAMRQSETEEVPFQGFVVEARSNHYTNDECYANTYYGSTRMMGEFHLKKSSFMAMAIMDIILLRKNLNPCGQRGYQGINGLD